VSLVVEAVKNAVQGFDDTAASLVEKYATDGDVEVKLKAFIEAS
jgi:hypothetical protein